jgi:thioredoxin-related protein
MVMRRFVWALFLSFLPLVAMAEHRDPQQHFFQTSLGDLRAEAEELAGKGRKAIVLIFEMEECPFCQRMHTAILGNREVQERYAEQFGVFRIDIKAANPIVDLNGKATTEQALAKELNIRGTPTTVFFDFNGKELFRFVGPPKDSDQFLLLAHYVTTGAYRSTPFRQYRQEASR